MEVPYTNYILQLRGEVSPRGDEYVSMVHLEMRYGGKASMPSRLATTFSLLEIDHRYFFFDQGSKFELDKVSSLKQMSVRDLR